MQTHIELMLGRGLDEQIVVDLIEFFEPVATPHIGKEEEAAAKAWHPAVVIALTILGEWAVCRYVLDPLAERAEEWKKAAISALQGSASTPALSIVVRFEDGADMFEVEMPRASDEKVLRSAWYQIREAYQTCQKARTQGVYLDKIRPLSGGLQEPLVIGYEGNRPTYIINLDDKAFERIESAPGELESVPAQLFIIEQLARRLQYLQILDDRCYKVSQDQIDALKHEIEVRRARMGTDRGEKQ